MKGEKIGANPTGSWLIWWDGDLTRETMAGNRINKYTVGTIWAPPEGERGNGRGTANLTADLFGDWREEVVLSTTTELRVYTTVIPTAHRLYTLMHDPQYRLSIAWQNVSYNQPPHTSFYMGEDMKKAPKPNIVLTKSTSAGNKVAVRR